MGMIPYCPVPASSGAESNEIGHGLDFGETLPIDKVKNAESSFSLGRRTELKKSIYDQVSYFCRFERRPHSPRGSYRELIPVSEDLWAFESKPRECSPRTMLFSLSLLGVQVLVNSGFDLLDH
ncbi:hypothetical protein CIHG_06641 [Coccidioides immitis H538.4]|uniref:Uncharacterized protein n=3 Tax=Coccidioides immitis TaxID=5501 RepID=A0A0J8TFF5_COCIT|nr:hypothetical protein CIRG_08055 [Coccidioides immitis RMSCC 2394]KMU72367.1 hypothetical protein CISG_03015 [Coccidioides immitis RMSCC 3703]KMU88700.1 hypothetical protein CIHG_06641 [Coccidioides immitis H538.4]